MSKKEKYILVEWPESQDYMDIDGVYLAFNGFDAILFVPESIYKSKE